MAQRFFLPAPPLEGDGDAKDQGALDVTDIDPENVVRKPHHVHNWNINEFESSRLPHRMHCEPFQFAGHLWQPFIFPRGNKVEGYLSAYIECISLTNADPLARLPILFEFAVVNHKDEKHKSISSEATHLFSHLERDRGFPKLAKLSDVFAPGSGFIDPQHNRITLRFSLQLNDLSGSGRPPLDPDYNSKAATGFVGLRNQGATCYMNSLLQTLFHVPKFRKAVYMMPTETLAAVGSTKGEIGLALQRIFFHLQTSDSPVATKHLTQSFGWNAMESFMQHDVQEFNRVLCDSLEEKMKKTRVEGAIAQLFEGKSEMYVECINVDYQSKRTENFYDLSMTVKGCRTLLESFRQYVEVETLAGENKYRAEGHGLQDARKGVRFLAFPPVLQLQLKRFEYDPARDQMIKINDRFQFPETLDLSEFLHAPPDPTGELKPQPRPVYRLHSVLVHSGNVHGGHYYAYIRPLPAGRPVDPSSLPRAASKAERALPILAPAAVRPVDKPPGSSPEPPVSGEPSPASDADMAPLSAPLEVRVPPTEAAQRYGAAPWFKFDDDIVTVADPQHAIDKNFGGIERIATTHFGELTRSERIRSANAYMLVYVREADLAENLAELDRIVGDGTREGSGIPRHLQARFADEEKRREQESFVRQHEDEYVEIFVAAEKTLIERRSIGIDVGELEHAQRYKILKNARVSDLQDILAAQFGIPPERQQLWRYSRRENQTRRPNALVNTSNPREKRVYQDLCEGFTKKIHFYLRDAHQHFDPRDSELLSRVAQNTQAPLLLIFKMFDPLTQSLRLLGSATIKRGTPFKALPALFLRFMGLISIPEKTVVLTRGEQQFTVRIPPQQLEFADPTESSETAWQRALSVAHACDVGDLGSDQLAAVTALLQAAGLDVLVLEEEVASKNLFTRFSHEAVLGENMYCGDLLCLQLLPAGLVPGLLTAPPSPRAMDTDPSPTEHSAPPAPSSPVAVEARVRRGSDPSGAQSVAAMAAALSSLACPWPVPVDSPAVQSRLKLLSSFAQLSKIPLPFPHKLLCDQYLRYLEDRLLVLFKRYDHDDAAGEVVECAVSSGFDEVMRRLTQRLRERYAAYQQELVRHAPGQPPVPEVPRPPRSHAHIKPVMRMNDRSGTWRHLLPRGEHATLLEVYSVPKGEARPTLYYDVLEFPFRELETKTPLELIWVDPDFTSELYTVPVLHRPSTLVRDLMTQLLRARQERLADLATLTPPELERRNKEKEKDRLDAWPVPITPRGSEADKGKEGPPGAVPAAPVSAPGSGPDPVELPPIQGPHHILETAAREGQVEAPTALLPPSQPVPPPQPRRTFLGLNLSLRKKDKQPTSPVTPPDQEGVPRSPVKDAAPAAGPPAPDGPPIRLLVVIEQRIVSILNPEDSLPAVMRNFDPRSNYYFRIDTITDEDRADPTALVPIHRGYRVGPKAPVISFGPPFLMSVQPLETIGSLRRRVQKRLAMPDAQFAAIRLVVEEDDNVFSVTDDQVITSLSLFPRMGPQFGRRLMLEYRPRVVPGRDSYLSLADRPVKIYA